MARGLIHRALWSTKAQLALTLAAVVVAAGFFAARGLPPSWGFASAAKAGDLEKVRRSLQWYPPSLRDRYGSTPLHRAVENNRLDVAVLLLDRGAAVNAHDHGGWTPLHAAAFYGFTEIAALLLDRGAETEVLDGLSMTPLHLAACRGQTKVAELLIARGAAINAGGRNGRSTALKLAIEARREEMADLLRQHGAKE